MILRKRLGGLFIAMVLIMALAFLAIDVGFSLYRNDRFDEASPVCTLNVLSGDVKVLPADAYMWEQVEDGIVLEPGSRIKTGANSYASLAFSEGTTTSIEPDTDLIIDQLGNGDSTQANSILLKQRSGKTWNQVAKRSEDDSSFQIQTTSASIVVYGTLFSTEVDESGATLVQTAEGSLLEMHSQLQRLRELAVQSANDTYTTADRTHIQVEANHLLDETGCLHHQYRKGCNRQ